MIKKFNELNSEENTKGNSKVVFTGILLTQGLFGGSKSDGYKSYLLTDKRKVYALTRENHFELDDAFFYPFHKLNVIVEGELEKDYFLYVTDIKIAQGTFNVPTDTKHSH